MLGALGLWQQLEPQPCGAASRSSQQLPGCAQRHAASARSPQLLPLLLFFAARPASLGQACLRACRSRARGQPAQRAFALWCRRAGRTQQVAERFVSHHVFFLKESCFPVVLSCPVHAAAIRVLGAISQEVCLQHVVRCQAVDKQSWPYSPRCWGEQMAKAEVSTQVGLYGFLRRRRRHFFFNIFL